MNALSGRVVIDGSATRGSRRPPYGAEVEGVLATGRQPNLYVFAGDEAWERAKRRRKVHGQGSALVLPDDAEPEALRWPPVDAVVVAWPPPSEYARKVGLARALIRDGVRYACIEHEPECLNVWREGGRG